MREDQTANFQKYLIEICRLKIKFGGGGGQTHFPNIRIIKL